MDTGFRKFWWISWISWISIFRPTHGLLLIRSVVSVVPVVASVKPVDGIALQIFCLIWVCLVLIAYIDDKCCCDFCTFMVFLY